MELRHLVDAAFGKQTALQALVSSIGYETEVAVTTLSESLNIVVVLTLIDAVMISNLLIIAGHETFVSRLNLQGHRDQPEWIAHVNASVQKVKLTMPIIGISSIHLRKRSSIKAITPIRCWSRKRQFTSLFGSARWQLPQPTA